MDVDLRSKPATKPPELWYVPVTFSKWAQLRRMSYPVVYRLLQYFASIGFSLWNPDVIAFLSW